MKIPFLPRLARPLASYTTPTKTISKQSVWRTGPTSTSTPSIGQVKFCYLTFKNLFCIYLRAGVSNSCSRIKPKGNVFICKWWKASYFGMILMDHFEILQDHNYDGGRLHTDREISDSYPILDFKTAEQ